MKDTSIVTALDIRSPNSLDGAKMWELVRDSKKLDLNSSYFYVAMSHWFSDSCKVAFDAEHNQLIGLVIGFRLPSDKDTLLIWQIAVDEQYRGQSIAMKLLEEVAASSEIRYVEATIAPSNLSSQRLFDKWSASHKTTMMVSDGFGLNCFPNQQHEQENLYRIGPLDWNKTIKGE